MVNSISRGLEGAQPGQFVDLKATCYLWSTRRKEEVSGLCSGARSWRPLHGDKRALALFLWPECLPGPLHLSPCIVCLRVS